MANNKYSFHIEPGECAVVIPIDWAKHISESYREFMLQAETDSDYQAFASFLQAWDSWVEETSNEIYE